MNEKPKREWVKRFDTGAYDTIAMVAIGLIVGVLLIAAALLLASAFASPFSEIREKRENAPCAELSAWTIDDLPVRCFEYYGLQVPQDE